MIVPFAAGGTKISLGRACVGSSNYLICKSFGIDVTRVGYRVAAPALTDAVGRRKRC